MAPSTVKLRLINQTDGPTGAQFVVLDKSVQPPVAWRIFEFSAEGESHSFEFGPLEINACDEYGNYTPLLPAAPGDAFLMADTPSGNALEAIGESSAPGTISMRNGLRGRISTFFYRERKLFAERNHILPGQETTFRFCGSIWLGTLDGVLEGQQLRPAAADAITAEFSMEGLASADIVVSGGVGDYRFQMVNVVRG